MNGGAEWIQGQPDGMFPWIIFPLLGWGIGLSARIIGTYATTSYSIESLKKSIKN